MMSSSLVLRRVAGGGAVAAAAAAYTYREWVEFVDLRDDAAAAERDLPPVGVAQRSRVVPVPGALAAADVDRIVAWHDANERSLGSAGRTAGNGSAAYKTGAWETTFLHTRAPPASLPEGREAAGHSTPIRASPGRTTATVASFDREARARARDIYTRGPLLFL